MTCPSCQAPHQEDFCTECGEVFETLPNQNNNAMTIELSDKEIEAICFAHTKLQLDNILKGSRMPPKPKAHLLDAITTLGFLMDRIERLQKDETIPRDTQ